MAHNTKVPNSSSTKLQHDEIKDNKSNQKVPFYMLFTFADRIDVTLMIIGIISAVANGLTQPFITLIFGKLINTFGSTVPSHIVKQVSKVHYICCMLLISLVSLFFTFNSTLIWCKCTIYLRVFLQGFSEVK